MTPGAASETPLETLVADLTRPSAYPHRVEGEVSVVQTHLSVLFFAGSRVYKVKKAVRYDFVDTTSPEVRRDLCHEEIRLNARLAPGVYHGVVPVTREDDGHLVIDGRGETVGWAVVMDRLPLDGMLDRRLDAGRVDSQLVHGLAGLVARFHAEAATGEGVDEHGTREAVARLVTENLEGLRPFVAEEGESAPGGVRVLSPALHARLVARMTGFVEGHTRLLDERVRRGRIREGHGDLHAGNVCLTDQGIVCYDALEFSAALRCADVAADLAFLAMDLDRRGFRAFSRHLVRSYARLSGDAHLPGLMDFYKTHRALVRAKVGALSAAAGGEDAGERLADARGAVHLAASYQLPPALVLMSGLPATGKSTWARRIARPLGALLLRSDVLRKRMAGIAPSEHPKGAAADELYGADLTESVYRALGRRALHALGEGRFVVVDATFTARARRRRMIDAARRLEHPVVLVETTCPEDVVRARMAARRADPHEVSDADWRVFLEVRAQAEAVTELDSSLHVRAAHDDAPADVVARLLDRIVQQSPLAGAATGELSPSEV